MAIFIYCYEDLSARYVAFCSGIFSPAGKAADTGAGGGGPVRGGGPGRSGHDLFFFAYGLFYPLIYKYIIRAPKSIRNFAYVALACDFLSNMMELAVRSVQQGASLITPENVVYLFFDRPLPHGAGADHTSGHGDLFQPAGGRGTRQGIPEAHLAESISLRTSSTSWTKNAAEIETLMKQAFYLYKAMERLDADEELKSCALDISKNAHEIKGDYLGIVDVLKDTFINHADEGSLNIRDIVHIEKGKPAERV